MKGTKWLFRYHVGSIAFGSFIIAVMQMIKLMFEYIRRKYKKVIAQNFFTKCIFCCLECCVQCIDRCVRTITKNAYIQIALTDRSFCPACISTFFLIIRNIARFSVITSIGWIMMVLGKATVMALSGLIGYIILMNSKYKDQITSPIAPVVVCVIIAYLISAIFLSVYSFSSTAILHCFLLDEETKGNHRPKSLETFIEANDTYNAKR